MEKTVQIPQGVKVSSQDGRFVVEGPKGKVSKDLASPLVKLKIADGSVVIKAEAERRKVNALVGTYSAHLKNMIQGVQTGWEGKLKVVYSHFPIKVKEEGGKIVISNFLGERSDRLTSVVGDCKVSVQKDDVVVTGANKEDVGQTCANIEKSARVKDRDKRVFQDGIYITQKPKPIGKAE